MTPQVLIAEARAELLPSGYETTLIPPAGRGGYVPATDLSWLEALRGRHEQLAEQLAAAVRVPESVRRDHVARVAAWRAQVRAAGHEGAEPPAWSARLSDEYLAGRINAAQAAICAIVDDMLAVLRDADAACAARQLDEQVLASGDGFGGALVRLEHELHDRDLPPELPAWAGAVRAWRAGRHRDMSELETYIKRGHAPREEQIV